MKQSLSSGNLAYRIFPSIQSTHGFVCFECRRRASKLAFRASALTSIPLSSRRYASSEPDPDPDSFSERLRRKIWKQDESLDETNLGVGKNASQSSTPKKAHLKDYIPATTWEGLEQVGGPTGWWEEAWDRDHYFEGFLAPVKLEGRKSIASAIHQALVEIYTLNEAGLSLSISKNRLETFYTQHLNQIAFSKTEEGNVVPSFASEQLRQETLNLVTEAQSAVEESETLEPGEIEDGDLPEFSSYKAEDLEDQNKEAPLLETEDPIEDTLEFPEEDFPTASSDNDPDTDKALQKRNQGEIHWLNVSFHDLNVKFAVFKRVMQLTGIRIPDPEIEKICSAKALIGLLVKKPKPKKLAQNLLASKSITGLPNVHIMDRRYTPIDREKEIGRWKVIEEELIKRNLPVTGNV